MKRQRMLWTLILVLVLAAVLVSCTEEGTGETRVPTDDPTDTVTEATGGESAPTEESSEEPTEEPTEESTAAPTVTEVTVNGLRFDWIAEEDGWRVVGIAETLTDTGNAVIPAEINGAPVLRIKAEAFRGRVDVLGLTVPDSVVSIGRRAFYGCGSLTEVYVGVRSRLSYVGKEAFAKCTSLEAFSFPDGVTEIGDGVLADCVALTSIRFPSECRRIPWELLKNTGLEELWLPEGITEIGAGAFAGCARLRAVYPPRSLQRIGGDAFFACTALTAIEIPAGVTYIGGDAFSGCTALTSIEIPAGVETLWDDVFSGCTALTSVTLHEGLWGIYDRAFASCTALEVLAVPDSVGRIGENAFRGCTGLLETMDGVHYLGAWALDADADVTSVTLRAGTRAIATRCFADCEGLETLVLPEGLTSLDYGVLTECRALKRLVIPDSVAWIDLGVLEDCVSLEELTLPFLGRTAAYEDRCKISELFGFLGRESCDCGWVDHFYGDFSNTSLRVLTVTGGVETQEGALDGCTALERVTLGVAVVGKSVLSHLASLKELILCEGVLRIQENALADCRALDCVVLPRSLVAVHRDAFAGCPDLTVYYLGDCAEWETLRESIGAGNSALGTPYLYSEEPPAEAEGNADVRYWRYVDGVPVPW